MSIYTAQSIKEHTSLRSKVIDNVRGKTIWVPARPMNYTCDTLKNRLKQAWMVFTGKADTLIWDE
jgi:hypothetical protein